MMDYLEILRLHSQGYSQRQFIASARRSGHTVIAVLQKAKQHNITWPLEGNITNEQLECLFILKDRLLLNQGLFLILAIFTNE